MFEAVLSAVRQNYILLFLYKNICFNVYKDK